MDYAEQIIKLSRLERALSFHIAQTGYETHYGILRLKSRAIIRDEIEAITSSFHPSLPTYIAHPVPTRLTPIGTIDLIEEHNRRFILARLAVLNMKISHKWGRKVIS